MHRAGTVHAAVAWSVLLAGVTGYLVACYQFQARIVDDAYISFRFARHLAEGHGLVWNVGGERVEGYTHTLWILLLAGMHYVGFDLEASYTGLAIAASLGTVALLIAVARRYLGALHPWAAVVITFYVTDRVAAMHSVSGLETQLFVFLLCLGTVLAVRLVDVPNRSRALCLAVVLFAVVLCRPDGLVYIAGIFGALALAVWHAGQEHSRALMLRRVGLCLAVFAGLLSGYGVWKYSYFGYLLPNPFYVKSHPSYALAFPGVGQVLYFFGHVAIEMVPALPLLVGLVALPKCIQIYRFDPQMALLLFPPLLAWLYYTTIIHEMGFGNRFAYPTFFFIVVWAIVAVGTISQRWGSRTRHWAFVVIATTLIALGINALRGDWRLSPLLPGPGPGALFAYHSRIAQALQDTELGPKATITTVSAGLIPYRSQFRHIDPVGLTENVLAGRKKMTPEEYEQYLWTRGADVYLGYEPPAQIGTVDPDHDDLMHTPYVEKSLTAPSSYYRLQWNHPRFGGTTQEQRRQIVHRRMRELRDHWVLLGEIVSTELWSSSRVKTFVYVRRDSPYASALSASLSRIIDVTPSRIALDLPSVSKNYRRNNILEAILDAWTRRSFYQGR